MTTPLRVAIVGCGGIARAHATAYKLQPHAPLTAVYDLNPTAAAAFAAETGATAATSLNQLARELRPDAVSICTPPGVHLENCQPFLDQHIPILCEKPLAATLPQAEALAAAVQKSGTLFLTAFCHRFHPPIVALKKLLTDGTLGRPLFFRNIFAGQFPLAGNHRANAALSGGGCLMDNGAHSIDLFRFLVGEPTAVQACVAELTQHVGVEDICLLHLQAAQANAFGEICSSYSLPVGANYVEVYAEKGTAVVSYWNPGVPSFTYRLAGSDAAVTVDCDAQPDRFAAEIAHFVACVRDGHRPQLGWEDGLQANRIVAAAYESARTGRRVELV